jgi:hypothetical protein
MGLVGLTILDDIANGPCMGLVGLKVTDDIAYGSYARPLLLWD